jgi:hypothetical protein
VVAHALVALAISGAGLVATLLGATSPAPPSDVSTWVSAGGATAAVGGLVYVARLLAAGKLVSYPVEQLQQDSRRREDTLAHLVADANSREDLLHRLILRDQNGPPGPGGGR